MEPANGIITTCAAEEQAQTTRLRRTVDDQVNQAVRKVGRWISSYETLASVIFCMPVRAKDIHKLKHALDTQIDELQVGQPKHRSRNRTVLRARFGLSGDPMSLAEIGDELGLSKERVRQIEAKALRLLRHPSRSNELSRLIVTGRPG